MIDAILLLTTAVLWEELKGRLKRNFEVRIINDIFAEWEEISSKHWDGGNGYRARGSVW